MGMINVHYPCKTLRADTTAKRNGKWKDIAEGHSAGDPVPGAKLGSRDMTDR